MRVGKWVPLYKRMLPIPQRLAMAFGLTEGSELYLAPIVDEAEKHKFGCEVMVSPVPTMNWKSVCRLSVRLKDRPHALATATSFLREKRINILLSETSTTYQQRAHWDAICDLSEAPDYSQLRAFNRDSYGEAMENFLSNLSINFQEWIEKPPQREFFLLGLEKHAQLTSLTGLNDASFVCDPMLGAKLQYISGGIELPQNLAGAISRYCGMDQFTLPKYAMVTGNTEQRYLRVLFMKEYDSMFRLAIRTELQSFAGGGIGVLNQLLDALPKEINLIKASTHLLEKENNIEKNHIELIGHWDFNMSVPAKVKREEMKNKLTRTIETLELEDAEGTKHSGGLSVSDFSSPDDIYPRVFISYSTSHAEAKLKTLMNALSENNFEPVLGTDMGQSEQEASPVRHSVSPDVVQQSFQRIHTCVAFISLQVRRNDFKVSGHKANKIEEKFILPPWAIAEEVYAWVNDIGLIIRLKDALVEDPRYNRNTLTLSFSSDSEYKKAVVKLIDELNKFRGTSRFKAAEQRARDAQFQPKHLPRDM
jgi:hypothetical protein